VALRGLRSLGVFVVLVAAAAFVGSRFEPGGWYAGLRKPPLTPPDAVFPVVWSLLYLGIAVAGWLVWRAAGPAARGSLALWGAQLVLNAAWSALFFGAHRPGLALVELAALLVLVAATTLAFRRVRPLAAALLLPYAAWVGFAGYLNGGIWYLNR
jgi:tryptophan-rich sensory protein